MATSISFPITLNPLTGSLRISSGDQRIQEQILEILSTKFLERVLRPEFGTEEYLFSSISDPGAISSKVKFTLDTYLSDNIVTTVTSQIFSSGTVELKITFFDSSTGIRGNLVTNFNLEG